MRAIITPQGLPSFQNIICNLSLDKSKPISRRLAQNAQSNSLTKYASIAQNQDLYGNQVTLIT
jgi:hypothetical protein